MGVRLPAVAMAVWDMGMSSDICASQESPPGRPPVSVKSKSEVDLELLSGLCKNPDQTSKTSKLLYG